MKYYSYLTILLITLFLTCKNEVQESDSSFILIHRNGHTTSPINGYQVYILSKDKKPMDGYYVVGNELKKWEEFEVKNGILNGDYITYHPNGNRASKSIYKNGELHGKDSSFYTTGNLNSVKNYSNGKLVGTALRYFETGQINGKSIYENEEVVESISYDLLGTITSQTFIKDNRTITQTIKNGAVFSERISSNYDTYEAMKLYNEDGSLKHFFQMSEDDDGNPIIYVLDENEKVIEKINAKDNPQEILKYMLLLRQ